MIERIPEREKHLIIDFAKNGVSHLDEMGSNLLMWYLFISKTPSDKTVKSLLQEGNRVDHMNESGNTAFFEAARNPTTPIEVYKLLLESGSDLKHVNLNGETSLIAHV